MLGGGAGAVQVGAAARATDEKRAAGIGWVGGWVWRNPVHDPIRGVGEVRWGADGRSSRRLVASSREQDGTGRDPAELEQVLGCRGRVQVGVCPNRFQRLGWVGGREFCYENRAVDATTRAVQHQ